MLGFKSLKNIGSSELSRLFYCQLCKIINLLITRDAEMARNPAEEDTKFQVNSYVSKPGKDFSNQRMIGMEVFQSLHCRKGVREDYEVFFDRVFNEFQC